MPLMYFRCEICKEKIGKFDPDLLHVPLTSDQFQCLVEAPSHHPPFKPNLTYEWLRCPVCNRRPFNQPDRVLTDQGYVIAQAEPEEPQEEDVVTEATPPEEPKGEPVRFACQFCNADFPTRNGLNRHVAIKHIREKARSRRKA